MTDWIIRESVPSDIPAILSIAEEAGLSVWTSADYSDEFERPDSICITAEAADHSTIGFVVGRVVPGFKQNESLDAEIYNIGVLHMARRSGIGSALIDQFFRTCRGFQVRSVWLEVRSKNEVAINFYKAHGFAVEYTRTNFYDRPPDDANVMCSVL